MVINMEYDVVILSNVYPTEDPEKVKKSIKNIFPQSNPEIQNKKIEIKTTTKTLTHLKKQIKQQEIQDSIKQQIHHNPEKNQITIYINKQAAYTNKINLQTEYQEKLGSITLIIKTKNPEEIINWLIN